MNLRRIFSQTAVLIGAFLFSIGLQTFAFTQPSTSPPNANAYAPLNTGPSVQTKAGGLILNTGGAQNGLTVQFGNVGIGTTNPAAKLSVAGGVQVGDDASACSATNIGTLRLHDDSLQFCQNAPVTTTTDKPGSCNTGCPGGTEVYCISCWGTCRQYMCRYTTTTAGYRWSDVSHN